MSLSEEDRAVLDLATAWFRDESVRVVRAREQLGLGPTRFWQRVNLLIDTEEALAHDPLGVRRLRRIRAANGRARATRSSIE